MEGTGEALPRMICPDRAGYSKAWHGRLGMASLVKLCLGRSWTGRQGGSWWVKVGLVVAGEERTGWLRLGLAGRSRK